MKLKDLRNGDIVVLRNGARYMLVEDVFVGYESEGYIRSNEYDEKMLFKCDSDYEKIFDIVRVYRSIVPYFGMVRNNNALLFDRKKCDNDVDWSNVEVDTPIYVRNINKEEDWEKRHFAKYADGKIYVFALGQTSWTGDKMTAFNYAKLGDENE